MDSLISNVGNTAETVFRPQTGARPSTEPKSGVTPQSGGVTPEEVQSALRENGDRISINNRKVEFSYDDELHRVIVKVFSSETDPPTVVRQIPPEEYLAFAERYRELQGILFDRHA